MAFPTSLTIEEKKLKEMFEKVKKTVNYFICFIFKKKNKFFNYFFRENFFLEHREINLVYHRVY